MDPKVKQRVLIAVLVFNFVLIFYQLLFNGFLLGNFSVLKLFIGIVLALVGGAVGYVAVQFTQK